MNLRGLATSPSTETVHGEVMKFLAFLAGSSLSGAEFVEIVVVRDVFERRFLFRGAVGPLGDAAELDGGRAGRRAGQQARQLFVADYGAVGGGECRRENCGGPCRGLWA